MHPSSERAARHDVSEVIRDGKFVELSYKVTDRQLLRMAVWNSHEVLLPS